MKINFPSKLVNNNAFVLKAWSASLVTAEENNTSRALGGWLSHCPGCRYSRHIWRTAERP